MISNLHSTIYKFFVEQESNLSTGGVICSSSYGSSIIRVLNYWQFSDIIYTIEIINNNAFCLSHIRIIFLWGMVAQW